MPKIDMPSEGETFDVREPAAALRQQFLLTRPAYLVGSAIAIVIGPVLGYWSLAQYNGPLGGTAIGAVIGVCMATPLLLLASRLGRYYPERVTIAGGALYWIDRRGRPARYDFSRGSSRLRIVMFDVNKKLPPLTSVDFAGPFRWCPFLEGGPMRYLPLSQAAAEALVRDLLAHGWSKLERASNLANFGILTVKLRRNRKSGAVSRSLSE